ncbi:Uncharacterized protein FKW44_012207, partial [Caligus rogercresseyi]
IPPYAAYPSLCMIEPGSTFSTIKGSKTVALRFSTIKRNPSLVLGNIHRIPTSQEPDDHGDTSFLPSKIHQFEPPFP